jgi:uracil-DNA glycosylase
LDAKLEGLLDRVQEEARRQAFPVDEPVYTAAGKDPTRPVLFAGSLDAAVCIVGRDLGRDEVRLGQPLVGAGGSLVRRGILRAWGRDDLAAGGKAELQWALECALLTNTVPYKPPGNRAYAEPVKQRFRPFLAELLTCYWTGFHIITLGNEAFHWFEPYGDREAFATLGKTDGRFEAEFACRIPIVHEAGQPAKDCKVLPLPHPSPLNRRWLAAFPGLLAARLAAVRGHAGRQ